MRSTTLSASLPAGAALFGGAGVLIGALALRATAATRIYDHRTRPEDSPTFKVAY
jgi:hypothetical protein